MEGGGGEGERGRQGEGGIGVRGGGEERKGRVR
jgi:hypothetical protein